MRLIESDNYGKVSLHSAASAIQQFKIKDTRKAFAVLSSSLYKNPVAAVLRELACNAADAHITAGIGNRPIEVKLPNSLDSTFYVKDWGPGLSREAILGGLYVTYFDSTKEDDESTTGTYGLGSKSPFALTDSFLVTSAHAGEVRTYCAFLDEVHAAPQIMEMGTPVPAEEGWKTGLKVSFPVPGAQWDKFIAESIRVLRWFAVRPEVLGIPQDIPEVELTEAGGGIAYAYKDGTDATLVMGNVAYPLDVKSLKDAENPDDFGVFTKGHLIVRAPLGGISVPPSRESLRYTKGTLNRLREICAAVSSHILEEGRNAIRQAQAVCQTNPREAMGHGERAAQCNMALGNTCHEINEALGAMGFQAASSSGRLNHWKVPFKKIGGATAFVTETFHKVGKRKTCLKATLRSLENAPIPLRKEHTLITGSVAELRQVLAHKLKLGTDVCDPTIWLGSTSQEILEHAVEQARSLFAVSNVIVASEYLLEVEVEQQPRAPHLEVLGQVQSAFATDYRCPALLRLDPTEDMWEGVHSCSLTEATVSPSDTKTTVWGTVFGSTGRHWDVGSCYLTLGNTALRIRDIKAGLHALRKGFPQVMPGFQILLVPRHRVTKKLEAAMERAEIMSLTDWLAKIGPTLTMDQTAPLLNASEFIRSDGTRGTGCASLPEQLLLTLKNGTATNALTEALRRTDHWWDWLVEDMATLKKIEGAQQREAPSPALLALLRYTMRPTDFERVSKPVGEGAINLKTTGSADKFFAEFPLTRYLDSLPWPLAKNAQQAVASLLVPVRKE